MEEKKTGFRATPQEWRLLLDEYTSSGMNAARFCRDHGIPIWQMRYRLNQRKAEAEQVGFIEIGSSTGEDSSGICVEAGRFKIRVGQSFNAALLRRVAEALA